MGRKSIGGREGIVAEEGQKGQLEGRREEGKLEGGSC